ncbi:2OG-Fe(II) oxygenase [Prochlorococcus sp. MIT 1303]|uniref:2OG-Fe(II) oxygenase n=1 Tax=Prochlorococcus sp. MIT 1303 TaxID=1723647 RepID=UPI0007B3DD74|nr:2OG-Fe(II) oxygenase [Prochlorococcus sp. MIT 1303]KZR60612.1 hypothetical protein PMIT1303_02654 [Prochlorococcus sp. MIT 1303]
MKRIGIAEPGQIPHFIGSWAIEPLSLCNNIIHYFEHSKSKQVQGSTGLGKANLARKNSDDITILPREISAPGNEIFKEYLNALHKCYVDYLIQWPFLKEAAPKLDIGAFNIQRYEKGQHFKKIHTERSLRNMERELVFMTYLNSVKEGGSTCFSHYELEVQPKKGLTLIWPAHWTHAHKGNIVKEGQKYIITGWMDLC